MSSKALACLDHRGFGEGSCRACLKMLSAQYLLEQGLGFAQWDTSVKQVCELDPHWGQELGEKGTRFPEPAHPCSRPQHKPWLLCPRPQSDHAGEGACLLIRTFTQYPL